MESRIVLGEESFGIGLGISTFRRQFKRKTVGSRCELQAGVCVCVCLRITCRQQVLVDRGRTPHPPPRLSNILSCSLSCLKVFLESRMQV